MLEHEQIAVEQTEDPVNAVSEVNCSTIVSEFAPQTQALIANYLEQAVKTETDTTTDETTVEKREILRARLEALIAGHLELDATPEHAVEGAIRQLENERNALEAQQASLRRQGLRPSRSAKHATRTALTLFGGGMLAPIALTLIIYGSSDPRIFALMMFMLFGLPALLGIGVGLRARQRPALGTFYSIAILAPFGSLLASLITFSLHFPWSEGLWFGVDMLLFWMPIGMLTAALTGWARDRRTRKRSERKLLLAAVPPA